MLKCFQRCYDEILGRMARTMHYLIFSTDFSIVSSEQSTVCKWRYEHISFFSVRVSEFVTEAPGNVVL